MTQDTSDAGAAGVAEVAGDHPAGDAVTLVGPLADREVFRPGDRCPIARSLEVVGTRSAMLIIREALYGTTRFDDFADRVGITPAVASARLKELTAAGVLERTPYREPGQRTRYEYRLTASGLDLAPVVLGLFQWGGRHLTRSGRPPLDLTHADCGAEIRVEVRCAEGHDVELADVRVAVPRRTDAAERS